MFNPCVSTKPIIIPIRLTGNIQHTLNEKPNRKTNEINKLTNK